MTDPRTMDKQEALLGAKSDTPAGWLTAQFELGEQAFCLWFDRYVVDETSGILPVDDSYGFKTPDWKPDSIYLYQPTENTDDPNDTPIQLKVWQTGIELLAISQTADDVLSGDIFRWYRIPLQEIEVRRVSVEEEQV